MIEGVLLPVEADLADWLDEEAKRAEEFAPRYQKASPFRVVWDNRAKRLREAASALRATLTPSTVEDWRSPAVLPEIKKGEERSFVVAVRRAHSGKVYSFPAVYLNAYPLQFNDECPKGPGCDGTGCDDGCPTTGWYSITGDGDDGNTYSVLHFDKGDEFLGWRELPQWDVPALIPATVAGEAPEGWVLVPREPTEAMLWTAFQKEGSHLITNNGWKEPVRAIYTALVSAALANPRLQEQKK